MFTVIQFLVPNEVKTMNIVWLLLIIILGLYIYTSPNNKFTMAWAGFTGKEG
ncbi:hypothetical protein SBF1_5870003 [Candidatus Desulfosporosinus infrequens]|uniref:Uncharacterized protein n=1 Tax=Candidatus Desulfosporosinus infrequens TaxID=2043169 RepID=A0A2U3LL19_9FIRM|nr:hypothetical protein SBF1_5870003 [Candidatus Desulfosporosinus infrequens]